MRWVLFSLWLLLTPIWISYSSSAGSGPKVAFIPPALVLIALVLDRLWRRLVLRIAGEFEPSGRGNVQQVQQPATRGAPRLSLKGTFHPVWGLALPSSKIFRLALVAAAVGVCAGAVVGQSTFDAAVSNKSATPPTNPPNLPVSVQTEAVKLQLSSAEPKTAALTEQKSTIRVRIEEVKSQSFSEALKSGDIVSGPIPEPSAGTSGPPPTPQQQPAPQPLVPPTLLTGKPLGPATPLQMKNEPKPVQTSTSTAPQPENQTTQHTQTERKPAQTSTPQPQNQTTAMKPQLPSESPNAQARASADATTGDAGLKEAGDREAGDQEVKDREINNRGATGGDLRQRGTVTANAPHSGGDDVDAAGALGSRRQDARAYTRLYDSSGNRRDGSYSNSEGNRRHRSYSHARAPKDMDRTSRAILVPRGTRREPFWR
jgi:hypothetical protein